ncbi:unnamed protein product [Coregonus sp. 'balchen']|nr:unnamed protein product [Coregonus sp. 'balchen']
MLTPTSEVGPEDDSEQCRVERLPGRDRECGGGFTGEGGEGLGKGVFTVSQARPNSGHPPSSTPPPPSPEHSCVDLGVMSMTGGLISSNSVSPLREPVPRRSTEQREHEAGIPVATSRTSDPGHSSGASGSSSESESSSESDSDSESSSSDSECNGASRTATPEPEPPSTNKWQLDKWLNKVTPHNKALINTQPERESHGLSSSQPEHSQQAPEAPGKSKPGPTALLALTDPKERALLSPIREKAKPKTGPKVSEGKSSKVKSPAAVAVEPAPARRSLGKKQPKKVDRSSNLEEHTSWSKPINPTISTTPKEKDPPPLLEPPKSRTKSTSGKTAPRKEPRTTTTTTITPAPPPPAPVLDKKKHRGPSKIIPKSKEFIETESSSSECHSEPEELVKIHNPPCPGPSSLQTLKAAKDCNSNILSVSNLTSTCSTSISIPDPGAADLLGDPLFSPVPIVQNELLSPLRDFEDIKSLWVKIELSFLSRIPGQDPPEPPPVKVEPREPHEPSTKHRRQSPASLQSTPVEKPPSKAKRKHKANHCDAVGGSKKLRLGKDPMLLPPCISPIHNHKNISTKVSLRKQPRKREEKRELLPPLLSPLSDEPPVRQRRTSECSSVSQEGGASSATSNLLLPTLSCSLPPFSSSSSSSSSHKHRSKGESKSFSHSKTSSEEDTHSKPSGSFHGNGQSDSDVWSNPSSLSMDHMEPRRPKLMFNNTVHNADYYMQEAKKLKHKADALMEKFGKAVNYADGALSFIECGNAMERDPLEAKSPYTMYSETVELIRSTGTPSPLSLSPSPVSSVSSSTGPGLAGSGASGASGASGNVAIPQRIHHMAASHVNITNNILRSYEHWDTAEKLATESQEFFQDLDSMMEPLSQHSSMTGLVRYIRQGLHWLRIEAHMLYQHHPATPSLQASDSSPRGPHHTLPASKPHSVNSLWSEVIMMRSKKQAPADLLTDPLYTHMQQTGSLIHSSLHPHRTPDLKSLDRLRCRVQRQQAVGSPYGVVNTSLCWSSVWFA